MKITLFFLLSCLISAAALFFSVKIADTELGISTIICTWIFFMWILFNKLNQSTNNSDSV